MKWLGKRYAREQFVGSLVAGLASVGVVLAVLHPGMSGGESVVMYIGLAMMWASVIVFNRSVYLIVRRWVERRESRNGGN